MNLSAQIAPAGVASHASSAPTTDLPNCVSRLFQRSTVIFAWAVLAVALLHPPHETGLRVCLMHAATGVPCPGCGLIRSVASAARGLVERSWHYHPFGIPLLALCACVAVVGILPAAYRNAVQGWLARRPRAVRLFTLVVFSVFIVFGTMRAITFIVALTSLNEPSSATHVH